MDVRAQMLVFFSKILTALTEVLGRDIRANDPRMSAGCPFPKLPLWAVFLFLKMVSGDLAGEGLQRGFSRHGLPPQRAPLDTVCPLRENLNSVQGMVSGGYCEGLFADTVCWTRLRNTWINFKS